MSYSVDPWTERLTCRLQRCRDERARLKAIICSCPDTHIGPTALLGPQILGSIHTLCVHTLCLLNLNTGRKASVILDVRVHGP